MYSQLRLGIILALISATTSFGQYNYNWRGISENSIQYYARIQSSRSDLSNVALHQSQHQNAVSAVYLTNGAGSRIGDVDKERKLIIQSQNSILYDSIDYLSYDTRPIRPGNEIGSGGARWIDDNNHYFYRTPFGADDNTNNNLLFVGTWLRPGLDDATKRRDMWKKYFISVIFQRELYGSLYGPIPISEDAQSYSNWMDLVQKGAIAGNKCVALCQLILDGSDVALEVATHNGNYTLYEIFSELGDLSENQILKTKLQDLGVQFSALNLASSIVNDVFNGLILKTYADYRAQERLEALIRLSNSDEILDTEFINALNDASQYYYDISNGSYEAIWEEFSQNGLLHGGELNELLGNIAGRLITHYNPPYAGQIIAPISEISAFVDVVFSLEEDIDIIRIASCAATLEYYASNELANIPNLASAENIKYCEYLTNINYFNGYFYAKQMIGAIDHEFFWDPTWAFDLYYWFDGQSYADLLPVYEPMVDRNYNQIAMHLPPYFIATNDVGWLASVIPPQAGINITLSNPSINPPSGFTYTQFQFNITYSDPDNQAPTYVRVVVDGIQHGMSTNDNTYNDGAEFTVSNLGPFSVGTHTYHLEAQMGTQTARLPQTGEYQFEVTQPDNCPRINLTNISPEIDLGASFPLYAHVANSMCQPASNVVVTFVQDSPPHPGGFSCPSQQATTNSNGDAFCNFTPEVPGNYLFHAQASNYPNSNQAQGEAIPGTLCIEFNYDWTDFNSGYGNYHLRPSIYYCSTGYEYDGQSIDIMADDIGTLSINEDIWVDSVRINTNEYGIANVKYRRPSPSGMEHIRIRPVGYGQRDFYFYALCCVPDPLAPSLVLDQMAQAVDFRGNRMITASSSDLKTWDTSNWQMVSSCDIQFSNIYEIKYSGDGTRLATQASIHPNNVILNGCTYNRCTAINSKYTIDWNPLYPNTRLLSPCNNALGSNQYSIESDISCNNLRSTPPTNQYKIACSKYSPDGQYVAEGFSNQSPTPGFVRTINASNFTVRGSGQLNNNNNNNINDIDWHPNNQYFALGSLNGFIYLYNNNCQEYRPAIQTPLPGEIKAVRFSPQGDYLAAATVDRGVFIFRTTDWALISKLDHGGTKPDCIEWSPAGDVMAVTENQVYIYHPFDHSSPSVSIGSPSDGYSTYNNQILVSGTASDNAYLRLLTIQIGGFIDTLSVDNNHQYSTVVNLNEGSNNIFVTGYDANNPPSTATINVYKLVCNTGPILSAATVAPQQGQIGTNFRISIRALQGCSRVMRDSIKAYLEYPDESSLATIRLYDDGSHGDQTANDSIYSGQWQGAYPVEHNIFVDFSARDSIGNISSINNGATFQIIDYPSISGISYLANVNNGIPNQVSASIRDSSGIASARIHYRFRNSSWNIVDMSSAGGISWMGTIPGHDAPWCRFVVEAADSWARTTFSDTLTYQITDTLRPVSPSPLSPVNGVHVNNQTPQFCWASAIDLGGSGLASYALHLNHGGQHRQYTILAPTTCYTPTDTLSFGEWAWWLSATDSAGNRSDSIYTWDLFIDRLSPLAPDSLFANGSNPSPWTSDSIFVIRYIESTGHSLLSNPISVNGNSGEVILSDTSGIRRALYKIGSPPTSNYDTTGSSFYNPFSISSRTSTTLYLWLEDWAGNTNFNNRALVQLRRDSESPAVSLIQPNGGEFLCAGVDYLIRWQTSDNIGVAAVKIEGSTNSGINWTTIWEWDSGISDSILWTPPDANCASYRLRVSVADSVGNIGQDASNADFIIAQPVTASPTLIAPLHDILLCDSVVTFCWSSVPNGAIYSLFLEETPFWTGPDTSITIVFNGANYHYWNVRARSSSCDAFGPPSDYRSFVLQIRPAGISELISPENAQSFCEPNIRFSWRSVYRADGYDFELDGQTRWIYNDTTYTCAIPETGEHNWRVTPRNICGSGSQSELRVFSRTDSISNPPTSCYASDTLCGSVLVWWTWDGTNHRGFEISRDGVVLDSIGFPERSYSDLNASLGQSHAYSIKAYNDCGFGPESEIALGIAMSIPDAIPHEITASEDSCHLIHIGWNYTSGFYQQDGFKIFRDGSVIDSVGAAERYFRDIRATPCQSHAYMICAYNKCGNGQTSYADTGFAIDAPPGIPTEIRASDYSCNQVTISWNYSNIGCPIDGFAILRDGTPIPGAITGPNETTYIDTTCIRDLVYGYSVRAFNLCGEGPISEIDSGSVAGLPQTADLLSPPDSSQISPYYIRFAWDSHMACDSCRFILSREIDLIPADTSIKFEAEPDTFELSALPNLHYYWAVITFLCSDSTYSETCEFQTLADGINSEDPGIPTAYYLFQVYPNPFNPQTTIGYNLPETQHVTLEIFDILGRNILTLVDESQQAGYHSIKWNAIRQTSGVYFYHIQAGQFTETKKMLLMK
jgi:hypothetical protein